MPITIPRKPVLRRYGKLIVRLDRDGIAIRGHRKWKWRRVSYREIAWLCMTSGHESKLSEIEGQKFLEKIGAA